MMKILLMYPEFPETFWSFTHAVSFVGKKAAFPPLGLIMESLVSFLFQGRFAARFFRKTEPESRGLISLKSRFVPDNQITLLENGKTYFPVMEAALDRAKHEIYLISYIFQNDTIGQRIAEALRRAGLRGVKTHVLIDGFGSDNLPETMVADLDAAGVMVMKFRPRIFLCPPNGCGPG